jgi:hypothetical protein
MGSVERTMDPILVTRDKGNAYMAKLLTVGETQHTITSQLMVSA